MITDASLKNSLLNSLFFLLLTVNISVHLKARCFVVSRRFGSTLPGGCHVCFCNICHVTDHSSNAADKAEKCKFHAFEGLLKSVAAKTFTILKKW